MSTDFESPAQATCSAGSRRSVVRLHRVATGRIHLARPGRRRWCVRQVTTPGCSPSPEFPSIAAAPHCLRPSHRYPSGQGRGPARRRRRACRPGTTRVALQDLGTRPGEATGLECRRACAVHALRSLSSLSPTRSTRAPIKILVRVCVGDATRLWQRHARRRTSLEDRDIAALRQRDDDGIGSAFVELAQFVAEPPCVDPDDRIVACVEVRALAVQLVSKDRFLEPGSLPGQAFVRR